MADFRAAAQYSQGLSHSDDEDGSSDGDKWRHDDDDSEEEDEDRSSDRNKRKHDDDDEEEEDDDDDDDDEEEEDIDGVAMDEPVPKKQKITMGFNKTFGSIKSAAVNEKKNIAPITIKLGSQKVKESKPVLQKTSASVASAFNQESDEEEEMPPEAKMRMRNIGRDTPTSAGPNSFGKTRQGFCDSKKVFERQLKEKMEEVGEK